VSKTVNLPVSATPADVAAAYTLAHRRGCKGITVYRDRSRDEQVLTFGGEAPAPPAREPERTRRDCPVCGGMTTGPRSCVVCRRCGWSVCE
jgi:ribonucleoside-diphosphate reductase alpha chain